MRFQTSDNEEESAKKNSGPTPVGEMSAEVKQSTMSARGFYFVAYAGFYITVILYPCSLSDYVKNGNWYWLAAYICFHSTAIYLFLTTGANPGWVMPDSDYNSIDN